MISSNAVGIEQRLLRLAFSDQGILAGRAILDSVADAYRKIAGIDLSLSTLERRSNEAGISQSISVLELHSESECRKFLICTTETAPSDTPLSASANYMLLKIAPDTYVQGIVPRLESIIKTGISLIEAARRMALTQNETINADTLTITQVLADILKDFYPEKANEIDTKASLLMNGRNDTTPAKPQERAPQSP